MSVQAVFSAEVLGYLALAGLSLRRLRGLPREALFALSNLGGMYLFFFVPQGKSPGSGFGLPATFFAYLLLLGAQYLTMRKLSTRQGWWPWLAFYTPILCLVAVRYGPAWSAGRLTALEWSGFVGISYLAFRNSSLVLEIRNGLVERPGFFRYLGYSVFVPTLPVGPINPYHRYARAFDAAPPSLPSGRSLLRIVVGLVKYKFLGNLCFQLTYASLLRDDHYHPKSDLGIAVVFYYLFLYCNFSGACDIAIGAAGIIGIPVAENFDNPLAARNVKEFWNRWHITLSHYMRDVLFAPLAKKLTFWLGAERVNHAIAITIAVVFLVVGIWHGTGWNFLCFGAIHAGGIILNHYYSLSLKKRLGREGFRRYHNSVVIHVIAVALTFCYVAVSLFFFANTFHEMGEIWNSIR